MKVLFFGVTTRVGLSLLALFEELKHAVQSLTQLAAKVSAILPHHSGHPILLASGHAICLKILLQA